jgi:hypothetical protein
MKHQTQERKTPTDLPPSLFARLLIEREREGERERGREREREREKERERERERLRQSIWAAAAAAAGGLRHTFTLAFIRFPRSKKLNMEIKIPYFKVIFINQTMENEEGDEGSFLQLRSPSME